MMRRERIPAVSLLFVNQKKDQCSVGKHKCCVLDILGLNGNCAYFPSDS